MRKEIRVIGSIENRVLDLEKKADAVDILLEAYKRFRISQACRGSRSGLSFEECLQSATKKMG